MRDLACNKEVSTKGKEQREWEKTGSKAKMGTRARKKGRTKAKEDETSLFEVITYVIALFLVCSYGGYLYDKSAFETYPMLHPLRTFFEKVEEFSPFMEFLEDDNWATEERKTEQPSTKVMHIKNRRLGSFSFFGTH